MTGTVHIVLAMKPLEGNFASNAMKHGVSGLNIDSSRVGTGNIKQKTAGKRVVKDGEGWGIGKSGCSYEKGTGAVFTREGRWPANVIHDGSTEILAGFTDRKTTWVSPNHANNRNGDFLGELGHPGKQVFNDSGSAARFFKMVVKGEGL